MTVLAPSNLTLVPPITAQVIHATASIWATYWVQCTTGKCNYVTPGARREEEAWSQHSRHTRAMHPVP